MKIKIPIMENGKDPNFSEPIGFITVEEDKFKSVIDLPQGMDVLLRRAIQTGEKRGIKYCWFTTDMDK